MICPICGTSNNDQANYCVSCGLNFKASTSNQLSQAAYPYSTPSVPGAARSASTAVEYAGFWRRFAAYIIDGIVLGVCAYVLSFIFGLIVAVFGYSLAYGSFDDFTLVLSLLVMYGILGLIILIMCVLYFTKMESSSRQATLGKMALGIKVTNLYGDRISFGSSAGRYFSKFLSSFLCIGFFMIAFTEKKQGLHDMIASTLVITRKSEAIPVLPVSPISHVSPTPNYAANHYNQPNNMGSPVIIQPSTVIEPKTVIHRSAKLVGPDGNNILLTEATKSLGRNDFERMVSPNLLNLISRQHLYVKYENGRYYIEDYSSSNGTKINGIEIKGNGRQELRDGDKIEIAGLVTLTFNIG